MCKVFFRFFATFVYNLLKNKVIYFQLFCIYRSCTADKRASTRGIWMFFAPVCFAYCGQYLLKRWYSDKSCIPDSFGGARGMPRGPPGVVGGVLVYSSTGHGGVRNVKMQGWCMDGAWLMHGWCKDDPFLRSEV